VVVMVVAACFKIPVLPASGVVEPRCATRSASAWSAAAPAAVAAAAATAADVGSA
jgi:hypothetical protein